MGRRRRVEEELPPERGTNPLDTIERETPFEPVDDDPDDPAHDLVDEAEDEGTTDLDEPEALGTQQAQYTQQGGFMVPPDDIVGRPTSPPLWRAAHGHPSVDQLRMFKVIDGRPVAIGDIDAQASEFDFHKRFLSVMPKIHEEPARFRFRPLSNGKEVLKEVEIPAVHPQHANLVRLRASEEGRGGPVIVQAPSAAASLAETFAVVDRLMAPMIRRMEAAERAAEEERKRTTEERARMADERIELAGKAASGVEAISERMIAGDAKRSEIAITQQQQGFQSMLAVMQQGAIERERAQREREKEDSDRRARERQDEEDRRVRERRDYDERLVREREEATTKREADRREWEQKMAQEKIDRDDRLRREEQRMERERLAEVQRNTLLENERQRQHEARLSEMQIRAAQDREHAERMASLNNTRDHSDSAEGMIEKGTKLLTALGMDPKEVVERFMGGGGIDDYVPVIEGAVSILNNGLTQLADYAKTRAQTDAAKEMAKSQLPPAGSFAQVTGPTQTQAPPPAGASVQAADTIPVVVAISSKLDLQIQKAAREALRAFVNNVRRLTPDKWSEAFTSMITGSVASYHFLREAGLKPSMREAGAEPALVDAVVTQFTSQQLPLLSDIRID
jgi:hypothetical protein